MLQLRREQEAEELAGGDEHAGLYQATTVLAILCGVLCVASAGGAAARNVLRSTQASERFRVFDGLLRGRGGGGWAGGGVGGREVPYPESSVS